MIDKAALGIVPEVRRDQNYENAKKAPDARGDLPNFDKLMQESNSVVAEEREKEQAAMGGGEMRIGETKSDAEFREKLEKITGKKQDKIKNKLDRDDYLNLMVTQMKMQDPTKPMDNQEMATQLAQFNSVEQLVSINKQLSQLNNAQNSSKGEKLTQYLGMNIQVAGNNLKLTGDGSINEAFFDLPIASGTTTVEIKDANGTAVRTLKLGNVNDGQHKVEWDGKNEKGEKVPSGVYTFNVNASSVDGKPVTARTSVNARVDGISALAEGGKLDTTAGVIDPKQVIAVRAPQAPVANAQPPAANAQQPAANAQQPAANAQQPAANAQQPAAGSRPQASNTKPQARNAKSQTAGEQPGSAATKDKKPLEAAHAAAAKPSQSTGSETKAARPDKSSPRKVAVEKETKST